MTYVAYIVHYMHNREQTKAIFLELEAALAYAAKHHGYLGGLIEAPLMQKEIIYTYD